MKQKQPQVSPFHVWSLHFHRNTFRRQYLKRPRSAEYASLKAGFTGMSRDTRTRLLRSLAIFQLGESGEGRIATEIDRCTLPVVDADYRRALKLFVLEEGRHARMLGQILRAMGAPLLWKNWTHGLFHFGRRLLGIRLKLMVLFVAEIAGIVHYTLFARALRPGLARNMLRDICADERRHLAFHSDFFRQLAARNGAPLLCSLAIRASLLAIGCAACLAVILDHRATYRALNLRLAPVAGLFLTMLRGQVAASMATLVERSHNDAAGYRESSRPRPRVRRDRETESEGVAWIW